MHFYKYQACGNDFVIVDHRAGIPANFQIQPEWMRKVCDRHFGIGCDQFFWLKPDWEEGIAEIEIYNSDGTRAEMCGNGLRAVGMHFVRSKGPSHQDAALASRNLFTIDIRLDESRHRRVVVDCTRTHPEVEMGEAKVEGVFPLSTLAPIRFPAHLEKTLTQFVSVDVGNPHAVFFLNAVDLEDLPLADLGPQIEKHPRFPNRTNVEFGWNAEISKAKVRVWERGAGMTLACGSGACAVVAAGIKLGHFHQKIPVEVELPGGSVFVRIENGRAFLSGPAEFVFEGDWKQKA